MCLLSVLRLSSTRFFCCCCDCVMAGPLRISHFDFFLYFSRASCFRLLVHGDSCCFFPQWLYSVLASVCCLCCYECWLFILFSLPDFSSQQNIIFNVWFQFQFRVTFVSLYFAVAFGCFVLFSAALIRFPLFHTLMFLSPSSRSSHYVILFTSLPVSAMHLGNATGYGFRS